MHAAFVVGGYSAERTEAAASAMALSRCAGVTWAAASARGCDRRQPCLLLCTGGRACKTALILKGSQAMA